MCLSQTEIHCYESEELTVNKFNLDVHSLGNVCDVHQLTVEKIYLCKCYDSQYLLTMERHLQQYWFGFSL